MSTSIYDRLTPAAKQVMELAFREALASGSPRIASHHINTALKRAPCRQTGETTETPRAYYDENKTPLAGHALLDRRVTRYSEDSQAFDRTDGTIIAYDNTEGLFVHWPDNTREWCEPTTLLIHGKPLPPRVQITTEATHLIHREGKQLLIATDGHRLALHLVDTPKGTHPGPPPPSDTTPPSTP